LEGHRPGCAMEEVKKLPLNRANKRYLNFLNLITACKLMSNLFKKNVKNAFMFLESYGTFSLLPGIHKIMFLCILSTTRFLSCDFQKMTVKELFIALCFIASAILAVYGGWNYMKGRISQYEETAKAEKLAIQGYHAEEALQKIRKEKTNSLMMFAAGVTGLFLIITNASRKRSSMKISTKKTIKENQL
jgi:hypothetical protein